MKSGFLPRSSDVNIIAFDINALHWHFWHVTILLPEGGGAASMAYLAVFYADRYIPFDAAARARRQTPLLSSENSAAAATKAINMKLE